MSQSELVDRLEAASDETAWTRVLIEQSGETWVLRYGFVVIGARPTSWPGRSWTYEGVRFLASELPASDLMPAVTSTDGAMLAIDGIEVAVPALQVGQVQHRPSFELHDRERMPLPTYEYALLRADAQNHATGSRPGFFVGPESPTFTDLDSAYRAFFLGVYEIPANASVPTERLQIRLSDRRAWLGPIHLDAAEMTVMVHGDECDGVTLEYFSPTFRTRLQPDGAGVFTVPLPDGLGTTNTWVWLTSGTDWRDYRALTGPWTDGEQLEQAGVERAFTSHDVQVAVEAIVYGGEGPKTEFKGRLPESGKATERMFNTIAAFANGAGGTVVIGVDRDEVTVLGLGDGVDTKKERDRVGQLIRTRVQPTPPFEVTDQIIEGKTVLFVEVQTGAAPPYGVITHLDHRDKPEFFVRRGASTFRALPSDLNEIVQRVAQASRNGSALPFNFGL